MCLPQVLTKGKRPIGQLGLPLGLPLSLGFAELWGVLATGADQGQGPHRPAGPAAGPAAESGVC